MLIPFGSSDWVSSSQNIARFKLRNMYVTENPASADGVSRLTRPSLSQPVSVGAGPITGIWKEPGALSDLVLITSGSEVFKWDRNNPPSKLGDLPSSGLVEFATTGEATLLLSSGSVFLTDGDALTAIATPDDVLISSICSINGYFLLSVEGTGRFYWMEPGQEEIDPLNFATAERFPDATVALRTISDEVWMLGQQGAEVWAPTGNSVSPFERIPARVYNEGCVSSASARTCSYNGAPALLWTTTKGSVVMAQGAVKTISTEAVEELVLSDLSNIRAWYFERQRRDFYILTTNSYTFAYDLQAGLWSRWDTYGLTYWTGHVGAQSGETVYSGDSEDALVWTLGNDSKDGNGPIVREISGFVQNIGKPFGCNFVSLRVNSGWAPVYDYEPTVEMRWSDDNGFTWSNYISASLGNRGEFEDEVIFRSIGLVKRPGRVFEVRFSEDASFRLDYGILNEYPNADPA